MARSILNIFFKTLMMYNFQEFYVNMQMTPFSGSKTGLSKMIRKTQVAEHIPFHCTCVLVVLRGRDFHVDSGLNVSFISHQPRKPEPLIPPSAALVVGLLCGLREIPCMEMQVLRGCFLSSVPF